MWMGASPERLIQTNGNKLKTMALAGTQPYLGKLNVSWTEKDQHEQEFVTEYILEQLKDLTKSLHVSGPETVIAGNLLHLRTTITAEMNSNDFLEELIEKIHPTPAVCGVPKNKAASYILENEGYDRSYYSGYLGELNMNNSNTLFVNLRCMEIVGQTATLFVGGGITKDSIPENEWRETVDKAFIMKSILNE